MKTKLKLIPILFLAGLIIVPLFAFAWEVGDSLVPCGGCGGYNVKGECIKPEPACDFCYFVTMVDNVQSFLLQVFILPVGVIALIIAGIMLLTAGGNPGQIEKGKSIFKYTIIGILIAFAAWLIVDTILGNLLIQEGQPGYFPWNTFPDC